MARVWVVIGIIEIAFLIFSLIDLFLTEKWRVRGVPKWLWFFIILLVIPPIGAILWFSIGKQPVDKTRRVQMSAPDDDPGFLRTLRDNEEQNERIRKLEQELADLDDDPPKE
jgi:hypothetical protein